jgi:hypothetical protein
METLKTELHVQDRTLKQIKHQGSVALYELHGPQGILYGLEVIVIRIRRAEELFGRSYPQREVYPSNEEWGTYGWSYQATDLAGAHEQWTLRRWALKSGSTETGRRTFMVSSAPCASLTPTWVFKAHRIPPVLVPIGSANDRKRVGILLDCAPRCGLISFPVQGPSSHARSSLCP